MAQRPKFKVPNYGMGRKSWVIALLQKLKPCIIENYASYMGMKKDEDNAGAEIILSGNAKGSTAENQNPTKADINNVQTMPAKSIWQGSVKHGAKQRLPTIPEVSEVPKEFIDRSNQTDKKKINLSDEELKLLLPINRYINSKLSQYQLPKLFAELAKNLVEVEIINMRPQYVIMLPEPRIACRIEIDLTNKPSSNLIMSGIHFKEAIDSNPKARYMLNGYDHENNAIAGDICDRMQAIGLKEINKRPTSFLDKLPTFLEHIPNRLVKFVLAYFFVFCVIGYLCTVFL